MADEGAGGNIAGEQHRADNPGDPGGERQRSPEQTLLGERGATRDGCRMEKQQIGRAALPISLSKSRRPRFPPRLPFAGGENRRREQPHEAPGEQRCA